MHCYYLAISERHNVVLIFGFVFSKSHGPVLSGQFSKNTTVNPIYLAVLIARLVGIQAAQSMQDR